MSIHVTVECDLSGELIDIPQYNPSDGTDLYRVVHWWDEELGEEVQKFIKPELYLDGLYEWRHHLTGLPHLGGNITIADVFEYFDAKRYEQSDSCCGDMCCVPEPDNGIPVEAQYVK